MIDKNDMNQSAYHWIIDVGATVIPANTREKTVIVNWKPYQKVLPSKEQYERWKTDGAFNDGMAVISGKIHHSNPHKNNLYLICVDLDNQLAIDEFVQEMVSKRH